jgi:hypothetical protein
MNDRLVADQVRYVIVLVDHVGKRLLLEQVGHHRVLPEFAVSRYARPAEALTAQVLQKWNIRSIVLDFVATTRRTVTLAVLEAIVNTPLDCGAEANWESLDIISSSLIPEDIYGVLCSMLVPDAAQAEPFSKFGWLGDVLGWLSDSIGQKFPEVNEIRQLNAGGQFSLVRLGSSSGCAYWFKAVGAPNTHEYRVTTYLARQHPDYLPPIVAKRPEWHAWVMEEVGHSLHFSTSLQDFCNAARSLARLQRDTRGQVATLMAEGFVDHRVATLEGKIDEVIEFLIEAMRDQKSTKVAPLSSDRLLEIRDVLHAVCHEVTALEVPDTALHGDISPGSVLSDGIRYVFTDWCEAYVGLPFITLEQYLAHAKRVAGTDAPVWAAAILDSYTSIWMEVLTEDKCRRAALLSRLLAIFSYLYGRGSWLSTERRLEPEVRGYARALAREMDRAATGVPLKGVQ